MGTVGVMETASVVNRARELAPLIEARAGEGEAAGRVVEEVFDAIRDAGLLRLLVPSHLGGEGVDPRTAFETIETVAQADGSTGWVTMILNGSFMVSWLPPETAEVVTADDFILAGMFAPLGTARPDGDAFVISGHWPFNSGSVHSNWTLGGVLVMDGDQPATRADGLPDYRFAVFPTADVQIHDTWHASGLRATSSHDVSVDDVVVPASMMIAPLFEPQRQPGPLRHFTFFSQLAMLMAGVPLGIARRALDEIVSLVATKSRNGSTPLLQSVDVQNELIRAEAALRSARAGVLSAIDDAWATATADQPVPAEQRIAIRMATGHAARTAVEVVDAAFRLGGGGALYDRSPLQRCWRDIHAATHHVFFGDGQLREYGGVWLGLAPDSIYV